MKPKCSGCGRVDTQMWSFRCTWPDKRVSTEHYCEECRVLWPRQLRELGAKVQSLSDDDPGTTLRLA